MEKNYHFIGIGGIGMSGLARLLLSKKAKVSGSDISMSPLIAHLKNEGAEIYEGHRAENIRPGGIVIYTSDVKEDNPEYLSSIEKGCTLWHRSDLLAELLKGKISIAATGTHGKTTTSALMTSILMGAGVNPSFAIGGTLLSTKSNARFGEGEHFVFEADESDRSFLKYHPFGAIITNIDDDHLVNYQGSLAFLVENFERFISQVSSSQHLFWCRDDENLTNLHLSGQSYGFHEESDWRIVSYTQEGFEMTFDLMHRGDLFRSIQLAQIGRHNVLNAAAAFGLSLNLNIEEKSIRHSLKTFKGVLRRCEDKGSFDCGGAPVQFLDDYAHHPTEIETTLQGIRQAIGSRRLVAVFQPHRYTRIKDCLGSLGKVFDAADELLLTDIYAAGEAPIANVSHEAIETEIRRCSPISLSYVPRKNLSRFLSGFVRPSDVVVTLGAGDLSSLLSEMLLQRVESPNA